MVWQVFCVANSFESIIDLVNSLDLSYFLADYKLKNSNQSDTKARKERGAKNNFWYPLDTQLILLKRVWGLWAVGHRPLGAPKG